MASERTCGECRDCRHWGYNPKKKQEKDAAGKLPCMKLSTPGLPAGLWMKPDFGCVLFEAKPAPRVADYFTLTGEVVNLSEANALIERFAGNVSLTDPFTHVYHSAKHTFLFRYEEEETDR